MNKIILKAEIYNLFKDLKIQYINDYIVDFKSLLKVNPYESNYYLDNKDEFDLLVLLYGEQIKKRSLAEVYISKTESKGYGLFSNITLPKNSFIGVYLGVIKEEDEMVAFDKGGYDTDYAWDYPDEIEGFPILEINAKYSGNELRFANHDQNPNIRVEHTIIDDLWYIFFLADRDINKDEELTISYGDAYWDTEYRELD